MKTAGYDANKMISTFVSYYSRLYKLILQSNRCFFSTGSNNLWQEHPCRRIRYKRIPRRTSKKKDILCRDHVILVQISKNNNSLLCVCTRVKCTYEIDERKKTVHYMFYWSPVASCSRHYSVSSEHLLHLEDTAHISVLSYMYIESNLSNLPNNLKQMYDKGAHTRLTM